MPRAVHAEVKAPLEALCSGEQIYFQKFATYADVSGAVDIRSTLAVEIGESARRWIYSVHDVYASGFTAEALGRDGTRVARTVVTLRYVRGQALVWTVEKRH